MDYEKLGLKIGLEIHQQVNTSKLFCNCPSELVETQSQDIVRMLRPTQSEMGDVDKAAMNEARRKLQFIYQALPTTCLVEADEEPPHYANETAIKVALEMTALLNAKPVDELQFMRKIVIDGSNTAGFQRTGLIALDGNIMSKAGRVRVATICLEEDAARKMEQDVSKITYRLDRLGIPLVEIATEPDIKTPVQAKEVAEKLGLMLRATRKVKRGLGTIRQDLNISIGEGNRIEIKGVQNLRVIPDVIEKEIARQQELVAIKYELEKRGISPDSLKLEITELTSVFSKTSSKIIKKMLDNHAKVLGIRLKGFHKLLKASMKLELASGTTEINFRLGREFAQHVKPIGIGGIFHSDELPAYGITAEEVSEVRKKLDSENDDAFILVVEDFDKAKTALELIFNRAKFAVSGVPQEVRRALDDNSTEYMRPMPGAARMYPETDVPPVRITAEMFSAIKSNLPELFEAKKERYVRDYQLSLEQAVQLVASEYFDLFEELAEKGAPPKLVASTILNTFSELKSEGLDIDKLQIPKLLELFETLKKAAIPKETIPDILRYILTSGETIPDAISTLQIKRTSKAEVEQVIDTIIETRKVFILSKGENALGPIMGVAMAELKGKADGKTISELLKLKLEKFLGSKQ